MAETQNNNPGEKTPIAFNFTRVPDELNLVIYQNNREIDDTDFEEEEDGPSSPTQDSKIINRLQSYDTLKSLTYIQQQEPDDFPKSNHFSMLKVNVSPLFHSHCLYVPLLLQILPQEISNLDSITDLLTIFSKNKPLMPANPAEIWIGFNSKGALASVDHLHFHIGPKSRLL